MKRKPIGRPREGSTAETRRRILRAAEESFAAAGYAGATTRRVARRAGVNVATLHYHFGSKEGLYRAVLAEEAAGAPPPPDGPENLAERLTRTVEELCDSGSRHRSLSRLRLLDLLAGPTGDAGAGDREDPRVALLRGLLTTTPKSSREALPPAVAARWIVTLIDGSLLSARDGTAATPRPEADHALSRAGVVAAALRVTGLG